MSVRSNLFSRIAILGVVAVASMAFSLRTANAETLTIDSAASNVGINIQVGQFQDAEGNNAPSDGSLPYYGPGDISPDDGLPVTFVSLGSSVGQADPSVPPGTFLPGPVPGGIVPLTSDGSTTNLNGTLNVSPGAFSINSGNVGLNTSGLWQPGNGTDLTAAPIPAELGVYLNIPGFASLIATLDGTNLTLNTAAVPLGPGGSFSDPNGAITINTTTITAVVPGLTHFNSTLTNESATTALNGTYTSVGPLSTLSIPSFSATTYADLTAATGLTGFFAQINETGTVVATAVVPEPSTLILAGFGLVGLAFTGFRRIRK